MNAHDRNQPSWRNACGRAVAIATLVTLLLSAAGRESSAQIGFRCGGGSLCGFSVVDTTDSPGGDPGPQMRYVGAPPDPIGPAVCYPNRFGHLRFADRFTAGWAPVTVDTSGVVRGISLDYDPTGVEPNPVIAYFDETHGQLRVAKRISGVWQTEIVDGPGSLAQAQVEMRAQGQVDGRAQTQVDPNPIVGMYPSLSIDPDGNVYISYYDLTNGDLKVAYQLSGSSTWDFCLVDTAGRVGLWSSTTRGTHGFPSIAYYDSTNGALKWAFFPPTGATASVRGDRLDAGFCLIPTTLDDSADVGAYCTVTGNRATARVAYKDRTHGWIKYAYPATGLVETVDSSYPVLPDGPELGLSIASIGAGPDSAAITFYNPTTRDLMLYTRVGGNWRIAALDTTGDVGSTSSCEMRATDDSLYVCYRSNSEASLRYVSVLQPFLREANQPADPICKDLYVTDGTVNAIAESAGTLYIGGTFTQVGPATGSAVPIDATTGLPQGLPRVDGEVDAVAPDGSGGWYVGGLFTHVAGVARSNLAHIASDHTLTGWNPAPNARVRALVVSGGVVYAGGYFTTIGPAHSVRNGIAALDLVAGVPTSWNPNANSYVTSLAAAGSVVYAGGGFTSIGGLTRRAVAALDASGNAVAGWNANANSGSSVWSIAVSGSTVYVGGEFTSIGGQPRSRIAALDASSGNAVLGFDPGASSTVYALAVGGSVLYAGGAFTTIGGQARNRIAALDAVSGSVSLTWNPNAFGPSVLALTTSGSVVYAGGSFTAIGGQPRRRIAALDVGTGNATAWNPSANGIVFAIGTSGTTVFAGGLLTSVGGPLRNHIAALDEQTGAVTSWNPNANHTVRALAVKGGTVYAGGEFDSIGGQSRVFVAALDAVSGLATGWDPESSGGYVRALVAPASGTRIYAAGDFDFIGGAPRNRIAALDESSGLATSWNPNADGAVVSLAVAGATVYAGGDFSNIGGAARARIAAIDSTGIATSWDPHADSTVRAIAVNGSIVYAGGPFDSLGGQPRHGIAALDATSGIATSWHPLIDGSVNGLSRGGSAVYLGGDFTTISGQSRTRGGATYESNGLATPWDPQPNGVVNAVRYGGGRIFLGGSFTSVGGLPASGIACAIPVELVSVPPIEAPDDLAFTARLFPNPTSSRARVDFSLSRAAHVRIHVYDVQGRTVARLLDQVLPAGRHDVVWDGKGSQGPEAAGVYFVRMDVGRIRTTRPLVLFR